jgi:hypothetical protein
VTLTGEEWVTLALRVLLIGLLYGAIALVVRVGLGELKALAEVNTPVSPDEPLRLVEVGGAPGRAGRNWPLQPVTTIGRTSGNTVAIDDPYLSGEHAEIVREAGAWWVRDLGSTNGTLLNGVAVGGRTAIRPGDVVQFGSIRLQLLVGADARG